MNFWPTALTTFSLHTPKELRKKVITKHDKRECSNSTCLSQDSNSTKLGNDSNKAALKGTTWHSDCFTFVEENPYHQKINHFNAEECSNYCTTALISHTSKVILKILQVRLQRYMNHELPEVQAGFRKNKGTRDQIANICWLIKNQENSRKTSTSASQIMLKPLIVWITTNCGKSSKRWEYQTTSPAS